METNSAKVRKVPVLVVRFRKSQNKTLKNASAKFWGYIAYLQLHSFGKAKDSEIF